MMNNRVTVEDHYLLVPHRASPARHQFQARLPEIFAALHLDESSRVCDLGCGSGLWRYLFSPRSYFGTDKYDCEFAAKSVEGYRFMVADSRSLPLRAATFDAVFANACLEHIERPEEAIRESARILRLGGRIVVIVPTPLSVIYDELPFLPLSLLRRGGGHAHTYFSRRMIETMLEAEGFTAVRIHPCLGPAGSLLKTIYVLSLLPGWLWDRLKRKLLGAPLRRGLVGSATTWHARTVAELNRLQSVDAVAGVVHRLYRFALRAVLAIDRLCGPRYSSEIWVEAIRDASARGAGQRTLPAAVMRTNAP